MPLKYGLNISKKNNTKKQPRAANLLQEGSDSEVEGRAEMNERKWESHAISKREPTEEGEDLTDVYDYDGAWDGMKAVQDRKMREVEEAKRERKPKYMERLLAAAELRKRDQLRAKERLVEREREAEGDMYAGKDTFVTTAYQKQKETLRQLEEEERLHEDHQKRKSQGASSFYRNMMDESESRHREIMQAAGSGQTKAAGTASQSISTKTDVQIAREAKESTGKDVTLNDDGQIVDKRQLLRAGLNVSSKPKPPPKTNSIPVRVDGKHSSGHSSRQKQSEMIEDQLAQSQKRQFEETERKQEALRESNKSAKTHSDVQSARDRYLARKAASKT